MLTVLVLSMGKGLPFQTKGGYRHQFQQHDL